MTYNHVKMTYNHVKMTLPIVKVSAVLESRASELAGGSHYWWGETSSNERTFNAAMRYITNQCICSLALPQAESD